MNKETASNLRKEIVDNNPLLYLGAINKKDSEHGYFGFECGDGWLDKISELSTKLEFYNYIIYSKYRCYVRAAQVKEKFGTLRFYYDVVQDPHPMFKCISMKLRRFGKSLLANHDFGMKKVIDEPYHIENRHDEITKDEYDRGIAGVKCSNVYYVEKDGKYYRDAEYPHYERNHYEPTIHLMRWHISHFITNLGWFVRRLGYGLMPSENSIQKENAIAFLEANADALIRKCEDDLYNVCEDCGWNIGTKLSPRCETTGWITYICKDCADKKNVVYVNHSDDKKYKNGTEVVEEKKDLTKNENA